MVRHFQTGMNAVQTRPADKDQKELKTEMAAPAIYLQN